MFDLATTSFISGFVTANLLEHGTFHMMTQNRCEISTRVNFVLETGARQRD